MDTARTMRRMRLGIFPAPLRSLLLAAAWVLSAPGGAAAFITDPTAVVPQPALALPTEGVGYLDPAFGTQTVRIQGARPEYSELQVWNADMTLMWTRTGQIRDARTLQIVHTIDWGFPDWGEGIRWSPVDPLVLYYIDTDNSFCSGAGALMRYRLIPGTPMTRVRELVRCFPEYTRLFKNESYEEISDDGRYIALIGRKPKANAWGWIGEAFVYDLVNNVKHRAVELPTDSNGPRLGDHIAMTPSGRYVLHFWSVGTARYRGTEAYDLDMNYLGKVHTGGTPHSSITQDANGDEWLVADNASNASLLTDKRYIVKAKIPVGVIFNASGGVDVNATLSSGATVPLLDVDWSSHMHISGLNRNNPGWVIASTYSAQNGFNNGWQPFENEVFKVYLDSRSSAPHVERLAHHRSHYSAVTGRDPCSNYSNYWAQPHATVSPDGRRILFGSNWGRICDTSDPVDGFLLTLEPGVADIIPPAPPANLRTR